MSGIKSDLATMEDTGRSNFKIKDILLNEIIKWRGSLVSNEKKRERTKPDSEGGGRDTEMDVKT